MSSKIFGASLALGFLATATFASAQTSSTPSPNETEKVIPEKAPSAASDAATGDAGFLSDKLDRSNGVIAPPSNIDPAIRQPTPPDNGSLMPVIPPPGTPGGRTDVKPK